MPCQPQPPPAMGAAPHPSPQPPLSAPLPSFSSSRPQVSLQTRDQCSAVHHKCSGLSKVDICMNGLHQNIRTFYMRHPSYMRHTSLQNGTQRCDTVLLQFYLVQILYS